MWNTFKLNFLPDLVQQIFITVPWFLILPKKLFTEVFEKIHIVFLGYDYISFAVQNFLSFRFQVFDVQLIRECSLKKT